MKAKKIAVLVTVLLTLSLTGFSQTPAAKPGSNMVYIPVAVTGPKNGFVTGMKKDNFVLLEDGIQQTITDFYEENQPIDLDLILFGDQVIQTPELTVPHPSMHERRFVLEPLVALAPGVRHPVLHRTARQLLDRLPRR